MVHIVGQPKTPEPLRNASDQFSEWTKPNSLAEAVNKSGSTPKEATKPVGKHRPKFVVEAVALLAGSTEEGKVALSPLGSYLRRTYPTFSPEAYGHSGLLDMLKNYDLLELEKEPNGHWSVKPAAKANAPTDKPLPTAA